MMDDGSFQVLDVGWWVMEVYFNWFLNASVMFINSKDLAYKSLNFSSEI